MSSVVGRFHRYKTGKQTITLSIAKDRMHVLHVVLNAPSTADMIFMTGGGIACFYFDWLREGISVCSRSADHIPRGEQLGSVGKINSDLCLQRGTYFLRTECGSVCPTFWQHVDSFDRTLRVTWDEQLSIDSVLSNADVEWRLNTYCTNLSCTYRMSVMASNSDSLGANTDYDVEFLPQAILERRPVYSGIIQGLFYGLACSKPFIVPVPVRDGVTSAATLDDLEVNYWVKQRGIGACTTSRRDLRRAFDRMPQSHDDLDANYIFYFDRPMGRPSDTPTIRFATYRNCTCLTNSTIEYPIMELSDEFNMMQNAPRLKEFMTFLVREGFICFFFNDAADGYVMADLFNDE
ncbi:hypothetical protein P692DRAFT_20883016 [Suillus brevipes Sb2]|nr:hypothetical protein P692DRAFT_20883016 [Suillus brevipes Sb2]